MPGEFVGHLVTRIANRQTKTAFELVEPLTYITSYGYHITAPAGFNTDLESLPNIVRFVTPKGGPVSWAAVIHDWLYVSHLVSRAEADFIFYDCMRALHCSKAGAFIYWFGVRLGGFKGWQRDGLSNVDTRPHL